MGWQHAPVRMRELGHLLALDSGALSPLLTRLEAAGLVDREKGPDQRSVTIDLTDTGRALRECAVHVPHRVMQHLGMDITELTALHDKLLSLITAANRTPGLASRADPGTPCGDPGSALRNDTTGCLTATRADL
jgi:DNA-binding MarR family transcriptional regulator